MKKFILKIMILAAIGIVISGVETKAAEETSPSGIPLTKLEETVDDYMKDYIGDTANGAAVIYIHNGEIKFSKGYGYADVENKIKVDPDKTVFEYASISKTFTWTAIMQLVEQGKINLDEDIMTYFPDNFNDEMRKKLKYKKPIRVIDLMNHRAGFEDKYFNLDVTREEDLSDTLEDALLLTIPSQVYEPDTVTAYSNYSTDLAGYLVECVTGKRLYDYLQENVFDVIGMNSSTANPRYNNIDYIVKNKAVGYGEDITDNGWTYVNGYPDGSVNGTASDLARFAIAYMQEDCPLYENQETVDKIFTTSYKASEYVTGCAHGFWEYEGADMFYQHDGGHRGFTNIYAFSPSSKTGLVVLTNTGSEVYVPYGLTQLILGENRDINVEPGKELPDAYALDGMEFLDARRNYSDITSLYSYIEGNMQIETIDKKTILCDGLTYVQTAPYFYELTDDMDNLVVRFVYSKLYFYNQDGKITGLSMGGTAGDDYIRCKFPYTNTGLLLQAALLVTSFIIFLIAPIGRLLRYAITKKKAILHTEAENKYNKFITKIYLCGFLIDINQLILVFLLLATEELGPTLGFNIQIAINYVLIIIFTVLIINRISNAVKHKEKIFYKKYHILFVMAFVIMTILLAMWKFFSFI